MLGSVTWPYVFIVSAKAKLEWPHWLDRQFKHAAQPTKQQMVNGKGLHFYIVLLSKVPCNFVCSHTKELA